jgi:hypothetical protein
MKSDGLKPPIFLQNAVKWGTTYPIYETSSPAIYQQTIKLLKADVT